MKKHEQNDENKLSSYLRIFMWFKLYNASSSSLNKSFDFSISSGSANDFLHLTAIICPYWFFAEYTIPNEPLPMIANVSYETFLLSFNVLYVPR